MSNDREGNEVETVADRGNGSTGLNDWMLELWKSEQGTTKRERMPAGWSVGATDEPASAQAPSGARLARGTNVELASTAPPSAEPLARGTNVELASEPLARGSSADLDASDGDVPEVSRKVKSRPRHRRRDRPRSKTIALKRLTREELRRGALANPPIEGVERPHTRAECRDAPRPCPWVACKHHLYLDINPRTGSIKINFPDLEPWELQHTCALDVADSGGLTLEEIGVITNLTRERVRQVEVRGLLTLKARGTSLR